jgi:hypothetical protein
MDTPSYSGNWVTVPLHPNRATGNLYIRVKYEKDPMCSRSREHYHYKLTEIYKHREEDKREGNPYPCTWGQDRMEMEILKVVLSDDAKWDEDMNPSYHAYSGTTTTGKTPELLQGQLVMITTESRKGKHGLKGKVGIITTKWSKKNKPKGSTYWNIQLVEAHPFYNDYHDIDHIDNHIVRGKIIRRMQKNLRATRIWSG